MRGVRIGEASNPGPLRVELNLGQLKVFALIDTGSDFDAIDADLSRMLRATARDPQAHVGASPVALTPDIHPFIGRQEVPSATVLGFTQGMQQRCSYESDWLLNFVGQSTWQGPSQQRVVRCTFSEFDGLGDPIIIGMPTIDRYGVLEVTSTHIWLFDCWITRVPGYFLNTKMCAAMIDGVEQPQSIIGRVAVPVTLKPGRDTRVVVEFDTAQLLTLQSPLRWLSPLSNLEGEISIIEAPLSGDVPKTTLTLVEVLASAWDVCRLPATYPFCCVRPMVASDFHVVAEGRRADIIDRSATEQYTGSIHRCKYNVSSSTPLFDGDPTRQCHFPGCESEALPVDTGLATDGLKPRLCRLHCRVPTDAALPLQDAQGNTWVESAKYWTCCHSSSRTGYFHPASAPDGPLLHDLLPWRVTVLQGHLDEVTHDEWTTADDDCTSIPWRGHSIFFKRSYFGDAVGRLSEAKYKLKERTNEHTRNFPAMLEEIEKRRAALNNASYTDQNSVAYRQLLASIVDDKNLVPAKFRAEFYERIICQYSDRFWHAGCQPPKIENFKAHIELKKGASPTSRQPYSLSEYDKARLSYLVEEEELDDKIERMTLGDEPPPMVTPTFIVEKKGSYLGRRVGDYTQFNALTEDYFYPAPDGEAVLMRATGRKFHTTMDCVWGFSVMECDEETARLLSVITPFGVFKVKCFPYGPKQGPPLYQHLQDEIIGREYKDNGEKLADVFFDDTHIADDDSESHFSSLAQLLEAARKGNIQYRFTKCQFLQSECELLGFVCGQYGRKVDPKKVELLRKWPEYKSNGDVVSHVAFCQYLREFFGPEFPRRVKPLRVYAKKETDFQAVWPTHVEGHKARDWLNATLIEKVVLAMPDWHAAAHPWKSGRPFECFYDASDEQWCVVLTQRDTPGGVPRPIGVRAHTFSDEATRWSAFEREFAALREGYNSIAKWVTGFVQFAYFDHKNIERAESVLKSRRASKKLVAWIADCQEMLANLVRVWIAGKTNVLADVGSRTDWVGKLIKQLPVPSMPILELCTQLFTAPEGFSQLVAERRKEMGLRRFEPIAHEPNVDRPLRTADQFDTEKSPDGTTRLLGESSLEEARTTGSTKAPALEPSAHTRKNKPALLSESDNADSYSTAKSSSPCEPGIEEAEVESFEEWHSAREDLDGIEVPIPDNDSHDLSETDHLSVTSVPAEDGGTCVIYHQDNHEHGRCAAMSLILLGSNFITWFAEIGSGTARLTQAVRFMGMTTLDPIDKNTGWDLTRLQDISALKKLLVKWRPLLTHFAPDCRIFSQAYHPVKYTPERHEKDMNSFLFALRIGELVLFVRSLSLFSSIEDPFGSSIWNLPSYVKIHRLSGFHFVSGAYCKFGCKHPVTKKLVQKRFRLLTDAPWLQSLGLECNHRPDMHTKLEFNFTSASAAYPWAWCTAYATALREAPKLLQHLHELRPISRPSDDFLVVKTAGINGDWPNWPWCFPRGSMAQRLAAVDAKPPSDEGEMRPGRAGRGPTVTLWDEEFYRTSKWLCTQGVPANKVVYQSLDDGTRRFIVHFAHDITDLRDGSTKRSLSFLAYGRTGPVLGDAKAAAYAYYAYCAGMEDNILGSFGVGRIKGNGRHGDERDEFRVYKLAKLGTNKNFNLRKQTFVPRETFCWNSVHVRNEPEYEVCKCLGHPISLPDEQDPYAIHYADGSVGKVRGNAEEVLVDLKFHIEQYLRAFKNPDNQQSGLLCCFGLLMQDFIGVNWTTDENEADCKALERSILGLALKYHWLHYRKPCTTIMIFDNLDNLSFEEQMSDALILSWERPLAGENLGGPNVPMRFDLPDSPLVPVHDAVAVPAGCAKVQFSKKCTFVLWGVVKFEEAIKTHSDSLELLGFPVPQSLKTNGLDKCLASFDTAAFPLTSLGVEKGRLFHMYKMGYDTRSLMAIFLEAAGRMAHSKAENDPSSNPWANSGDAEQVITTLSQLIEELQNESGQASLNAEQVEGLQPLMLYKVLGAEYVSNLKRQRTGSQLGLEWSTTKWRLTLGYSTELEKVYEVFEPAGMAMIGSPSAWLEHPLKHSFTLYFGDLAKVPQGAPEQYLGQIGFNIDGVDLVDATILSSVDIPAVSHRTGLPLKELNEAYAMIDVYRFNAGLLQRRLFSKTDGVFSWHTVVPYSPFRAVPFAGRKHRCDLRRYVVLTYHITPMSGHRGRDKTLEAIMTSGLWWSDMGSTVNQVVSNCWECRKEKAVPYVSGLQRSRDYDGPFRYLIIDFVGPIRPVTPRGHEYMFTCVCAFSGWYWAVPTKTSTSAEAALVLAERVLFDLAGIPVYLGSDRALAFVEGVISELAARFGMSQVLGSSFHPEAQGAVERPHRTYRALCRSFIAEFSGEWDTLAALFAWTVRTTSKDFNGQYTPYEVILGMKPRMSLDALFSPSVVEKISKEKYVNDLVKYLKRIQTYVSDKHKECREKEMQSEVRRLGAGEAPQVGDYVLYKPTSAPGADNPAGADASASFKYKWRNKVYQIVSAPSAKSDDRSHRTYVLCDAATGLTTGLGFVQPVAAENVAPLDILPLSSSIDDGPTRILLDGEREGVVKAQSVDGRVLIQFREDQEGEWVDLSRHVYRWLT